MVLHWKKRPTYNLLSYLHSSLVDDLSGDLVERYDGSSGLQVAPLQQQLARDLGVYHYIV